MSFCASCKKRNGFIRSLRAIDFSTGKTATRAINDRPYGYGFLCRQSHNKRNGQARSIQGCVLKFSNALTLREAATVFSAPSNRATKAFAAFTLCEAAMVLHAPSTPGYRNNRIRRCSKAPLKKRNRRACSLQWCGAKLSNALLGCAANTVSSAVSTPGYQR